MFECISCLTEAAEVEYFLHSFFGTIFLFQCNNYVPQKALKHCLVLGGGGGGGGGAGWSRNG